MNTDLVKTAKALEAEVIAWRRHLHEHPETAFQERKTAAYVADQLRKAGYAPRCIGETGIVAELAGGKGPGRTIGLRADMDALPGEEKTGLPFASKNPGAVHSCGHDAHTAILLGVAHTLARHKDEFAGRVKFFFQPAEEVLGGAKLFVDAGELDDVDGVAALHVMTDLETGVIGSRKGVSLGATDSFFVTVTGKSAHGSQPHRGNDAIVAAAAIVTALQTVVSRSVPPLDSAVVTVGKITGGFVRNVIAENAALEGTVRALKAETRELVLARIREIVEHTAASHNVAAALKVEEGTPPVVCDDAWVDRLFRVAAAYLPPENIYAIPEPSMGGEDFAFMLQKAPGVFWRLGVRKPGTERTNAHSPYFMVDEAAFLHGVIITSALAMGALQDVS
ncbi:M20 family metallopeptidase [Desulfovibrio sp. OttesenSCG-928-O18]|nr:M20 family metallopeptidase [Desulfovibrio sp. OttesenSCG-928-O18]